MIVRIVKMTFQPERIPAFLQLFEETKAHIRGFEGCQHLQLLREKADGLIFFTYSHWESEEHLNAYRDSALFAEVWAQTKIHFAAKPEAWTTDCLHRLD